MNDTKTCISHEDVRHHRDYIMSLFLKLLHADTVYRLGNHEYSYIFRDAPESALCVALRFGAWFHELKHNLENIISGENQIRYLHNELLENIDRNHTLKYFFNR